jgi:polar amino acid transport system substrate-binding protein
VVDKVKNELGLPSLQVRYQPLKINEEVDAISTGKVDIVCTPTLATLERRKTVNFSIPIYTAGLSVVVRKNASAGLLKLLNGQVDKWTSGQVDKWTRPARIGARLSIAVWPT